MDGSGDITVWINSPGGDCVAAAQIYNMLMDYPHNVTVKIDGTVLNEENDNTTDDIDRKLEELQQQLLIQAKSKNDYEDVADEIYRLRELKQNALVENAEREGKRQRIAEMTDFLNEQSCELEEYDEQLVRRLIEKVTVFDEKMTIEFKSGVTIEGRI